MICILDLPDELLLEIIVRVPYQLRSHDQLPLVCQHFRSLVAVKTLPGMIAWYQFAPFMSLLKGYRGRSTSEYSRAELEQTWKSVAMHREWMAFLRETIGWNTEVCMTAISLVHFIAASNKKLLVLRTALSEGERETLGFLFFVKVIQMLPSYSLLLLRYLVKTTLSDIHDRHTPYDRLEFLEGWSTTSFNENQRNSHHFVLDCINSSTYALLDGYRPFYNILTDAAFHSRFLITESEKTRRVILLLSRAASDVLGERETKAYPGSFAMHARLVELSKKGEMLSPLDVKVGVDMNIWERLSLEHTRMQEIDKQLDAKFTNMRVTPDAIHNLDLEGIGESLKDITSQLQAMGKEKIQEEREKCYGMYKLDQWM